MDAYVDRIQLSLPFKAEYVSTARLLASSIANKVGFDIEMIEDIKVAISEVCNKLVKIKSMEDASYIIIFEISDKGLRILFSCDDEKVCFIFKKEEDDLGIAIINAFFIKTP